ncbi:hypothetical protein GJ699_33280 [Duganella sp. FT80W]|uniref:Alpha/beta hydrolase n=1 Tax=Duganella guangzhouensis TaxID=2666084 RepID=A0A6I2L9C0_9BURK|nr:hypothetical protein [Duganella guangzhouensis]MRW94841.1 hypothetical protein [Duganella guangzhouensis]
MLNCSPRRALRRLMLLVGLLPACSTPYQPPLLPQPPAVFPGLIDLAAQAAPHEADVLLVHGICTHDTSWAATVVPQLTRALNDATTPRAPMRTPQDAGLVANAMPASAAAAGRPGHMAPGTELANTATAAGSAPRAAGALTAPAVDIVPTTVTTPAGQLRFDALIWSPLTSALKRQLCYDQSGKSTQCNDALPYPYTRAKLNARFKDGLIDDCLPDALIYQGVARDSMQRQMRTAILQALSGARAEVPLVVISHSMGSKLLFDTLLRMTEEPAGSAAAMAAQQAVDRMRFLVMAANQIPLLSLADQPLSPATSLSAPPDSLQLLLRKRRTALAADHHLTLVAFTDPNDLLSYTLPPERYAADGVTVYNILVSNAPTWPGLLERPDSAHLDYLGNPDVGRLITCGQPTSKLCK